MLLPISTYMLFNNIMVSFFYPFPILQEGKAFLWPKLNKNIDVIDNR